jgi:transcriptional regulator with XRE-family HTH domain
VPTLGKFVRRRRMELGLSQEELAARVGDGTRQADVSRLENDRIVLPRRERLERLAVALDVPLGHLLVRSGWVGANDNLGAESLAKAEVMNGHVKADEVEAPPPTLRETLAQIRALVEHAEKLMEEADRHESDSGSSRGELVT